MTEKNARTQEVIRRWSRYFQRFELQINSGDSIRTYSRESARPTRTQSRQKTSKAL